MKKLSDLRDVFIFVMVSAAWIAGTVYLFYNRTDLNFATWATFSATILGAYHWISMRDDKEKDVCSPS